MEENEGRIGILGKGETEISHNSKISLPCTYSLLLSKFLLFSPTRYYFQFLSNAALISGGYFGVIQYFGWKKVSIITQNENLWSVVSIRKEKRTNKIGDVLLFYTRRWIP